MNSVEGRNEGRKEGGGGSGKKSQKHIIELDLNTSITISINRLSLFIKRHWGLSSLSNG